MELLTRTTKEIQTFIDSSCEGKPVWKIICASVAATIALSWLRNLLNENESLYTYSKRTFFKYAKKIPFVKKKIEKDLSKVTIELQQKLSEGINNDPFLIKLPEKGWSQETIIEEVKRYAKYGKSDYKKGLVSGAVYSGEDSLTQLMTDIYGLSMWTNPLHSDVFPGIRKMEAEVVRMCCTLLNGDKNTCGSMTTGGTESIFLACKALRDYAINVKGIRRPEMLIPVTAHAAFDKSAHLLNMRVKHAPMDENTRKVDLKAMEKMITKRTCMLVGSAPQFAHGTIDPIEELGALGQKYGIPVHVDACLGGFLVAFMDDAGFPLRPFDFRVPGVISISIDTHKYGFSPKGSSVVLYRETKYRHQQYFYQPDWPGGIYATPTFSGSRPGGIIAATWAALIYFGHQGYIETTKSIVSTAKKIEKGCREISGIHVVGKPEVSVVAIGSDRFNIYLLSDAMTEKGWNLNALQFPSSIHIAVTIPITQPGVAEKFINDVKEIAGNLIRNPPKEIGGSAAIYGMAQSIPDRSIVGEVTYSYLDACYNTRPSAPNPQENGLKKND